MNLFGKIKKKLFNESESVSMDTINELFFGSGNAEYGTDLSEITYFTCLKTLSEALGKMPLYLMDEQKSRIMTMKRSPSSAWSQIRWRHQFSSSRILNTAEIITEMLMFLLFVSLAIYVVFILWTPEWFRSG